LTTSATGNFDFLSPLTLAGSNNTGAGVEQDSNAGHKSLSRQDIIRVYGSILRNNQGTVPETVGSLSRATAAYKQEQMNSSGNSNISTIPSLQDQLFEITAADPVQPDVSNASGQSFSIDVAGIERAQQVHVINLIVDSTGVPLLVGTSGSSCLTDNVSLNLISATLPVQVVYQPMVPNVLYQSQVYSA
jgi:hypothetical protein